MLTLCHSESGFLFLVSKFEEYGHSEWISGEGKSWKQMLMSELGCIGGCVDV